MARVPLGVSAAIVVVHDLHLLVLFGRLGRQVLLLLLLAVVGAAAIGLLLLVVALLLLLLLLAVVVGGGSRSGLHGRGGLLPGRTGGLSLLAGLSARLRRTGTRTDHALRVVGDQLLGHEALRHHRRVDLGRLVEVDLLVVVVSESNVSTLQSLEHMRARGCREWRTRVTYCLAARICSTLGADVRLSPYCVSCNI